LGIALGPLHTAGDEWPFRHSGQRSTNERSATKLAAQSARRRNATHSPQIQKRETLCPPQVARPWRERLQPAKTMRSRTEIFHPEQISGLSGFWGFSTPSRVARATPAADLSNVGGSARAVAPPRGEPVPSPLPSPPTPLALGEEPPHGDMLPRAVQAAVQQKAPPAKTTVFTLPGAAPSGFWGVGHPA